MSAVETTSRFRALLLAALFLGPAVAVPLGDTTLRLLKGRAPLWTEFFRSKPTAAYLRQTEKRLEDGSWLFSAVRPAMQWAMFRLFDDAGRDILVGQDGWLFYRPAVRFLSEPWPPKKTRPENGPLKAIVSFRDQLAAHGIRLLVVPAPNKASLYPGLLARRAEGHAAEVSQHANAMKERLRAAGIDFLDLAELFQRSEGGPWYLPTDTHWTPQGARLAARTTAEWLLDQGWLTRGSVIYREEEKTVRRPGDLVAMIRSSYVSRTVPEETVQAVQIIGLDGKPYTSDWNASVLILGDSFLRIYERDMPKSAGFVAHLARHLGQPVSAIISDGGASTLARQELIQRPGSLAGKRVVIWEYVERDYRFGTEGWRDLRLPENLFTPPARSAQ